MIAMNKYFPSTKAEQEEINSLPGLSFEEFMGEKKPAEWLEEDFPEVLQQYFKEWCVFLK